MPRLQNLIHLVAKDEKVKARNDLIGMSNHTNIYPSQRLLGKQT